MLLSGRTQLEKLNGSRFSTFVWADMFFSLVTGASFCCFSVYGNSGRALLRSGERFFHGNFNAKNYCIFSILVLELVCGFYLCTRCGGYVGVFA